MFRLPPLKSLWLRSDDLDESKDKVIVVFGIDKPKTVTTACLNQK